MDLRRRILWVDGSAAAVVGVAVLLLSGWLSRLYALPHDLVVFMAWMNAAYASFSLSLAARSRRPKVLIGVLVAGNLAWSVACLRWVFLHGAEASLWGLGHLLGEGLFVVILACLEWRWRELLLRR